MSVVNDCKIIIDEALKEALPDSAVKKALAELPEVKGKLVLVAIGKAGWQMAEAAYKKLGKRIDSGIVITKYEHSKGAIGSLEIFEAGHPVPDENSYKATERAIELVEDLGKNDLVLFLISGGGSALFEKPLIPTEEMAVITDQLLSCGADIVEMNTIRKRLSAVKGGKFAKLCEPARVFSIVLSDIIGDPMDMIASGPAYPDSSTSEQAVAITEKYKLRLSEKAKELLQTETPKVLDNVESHITGSVRQLCETAKRVSSDLGYEPVLLSTDLYGEAREIGSFLAAIAKTYARDKACRSLAFIAGGEAVVRITGNGLGGRNQEIALSAARGIDGIPDCAVFSVGSDGTDGPTDAAGGICTGESLSQLKAKGIDVDEILQNNDSYHALERIDSLIITGPTGTNVNDLTCLLIKR